MLAAERELLGIYLTGHPLELYKRLAEQYQLQRIEDIPTCAENKDVRLVGIISSVAKKISKRDKRTWAIITLEDKENSIEIMVYSDTFGEYGDRIVPESPMVVCGEAQKRDGETKVIAYELYPLDEAPQHFASRVGVRLSVTELDQERLKKVHDILRVHPGKVPALLCLSYPSGKRVLIEADSNFAVLPNQAFIEELEAVIGPEAVRVSVSRRPYAGKGKPERRDFKRRAPAA